MKILVVDDESLNRRLLRMILEKEPEVTVLEAADGLAAIQIVESDPVDIVLLDIMMPRIDGYETCKRMKAITDCPPVIFISAISDQEEIRPQVKEAGADDILVKPINRSLLLERIRAFCANRPQICR
jgi:DNA-binding response OmpR family regulator